MLKLFLLITLLLSTHAQTLIAYSDLTTTTLLEPKGKTLAYPHYYASKNPNPLGNGASNVIYLDGPDTWPAGTKTTFQTIFYVNCPQATATLVIFADDYFTAYLNGVPILEGTNCSTYTIKINL